MHHRTHFVADLASIDFTGFRLGQRYYFGCTDVAMRAEFIRKAKAAAEAREMRATGMQDERGVTLWFINKQETPTPVRPLPPRGRPVGELFTRLANLAEGESMILDEGAIIAQTLRNTVGRVSKKLRRSYSVKTIPGTGFRVTRKPAE